MPKNISRPAQGAHQKPNTSPKAAYKADAAPRVVGRGSLQYPVKSGSAFRGTTLVPDAQPRIIQD